MWRKIFLIILFTSLIAGCAQLPEDSNRIILSVDNSPVLERLSKPWMVNYSPAEDEIYGWNNYSKIIYPSDFMKKHADYKNTMTRPLVVWTGIVIDRSNSSERFLVEHHFWDWRTTTDEHLIFISSKGAGKFECSFTENEIESKHKLNQFVIVYGIPLSIDEATGVINMECMKTKFLKQEYFTSQAWSYGRKFVSHTDLSDIKILNPDYE